MNRPPPKRKTDWGAVNFAFLMVMTIITAAMAYAYFSGSTGERIRSLEQRVERLERVTRGSIE